MYVCDAQPCLTLRNPMDYSLPDSSVHGISQARILECPSPEDLADQEIKPTSPALADGLLTTAPAGKPTASMVKVQCQVLISQQ